MKSIFLTIVVGLLALILSCKKNTEPSRVDYLTKGSWRIVSWEYRTGATGTWTDAFATLQACKKDDETVFLKNGTYQINEGASKCNSTDPSIVFSSTWSLSPDIKKIVFPSPLPEWMIEQLNAFQLIYTYSIDIGPQTYYHRVVMTH